VAVLGDAGGRSVHTTTRLRVAGLSAGHL